MSLTLWVRKKWNVSYKVDSGVKEVDWEQVNLCVGGAAVLEDRSGSLPSFRHPASGLILLQHLFSQFALQTFHQVRD